MGVVLFESLLSCCSQSVGSFCSVKDIFLAYFFCIMQKKKKHTLEKQLARTGVRSRSVGTHLLMGEHFLRALSHYWGGYPWDLLERTYAYCTDSLRWLVETAANVRLCVPANSFSKHLKLFYYSKNYSSLWERHSGPGAHPEKGKETVKDLEHKSYGGWLRELGVWGRGGSGKTLWLCNCRKGGCGEVELSS